MIDIQDDEPNLKQNVIKFHMKYSDMSAQQFLIPRKSLTDNKTSSRCQRLIIINPTSFQHSPALFL